jgi:hypothetical protein
MLHPYDFYKFPAPICPSSGMMQDRTAFLRGHKNKQSQLYIFMFRYDSRKSSPTDPPGDLSLFD